MYTRPLSAYDKRVRDIADVYKCRGYTVIQKPSESELPEFLREYHPDLIARNSSESVVIEFKYSDKVRQADYWEGLTGAIHEHPGWKLVYIPDGNLRRDETRRLSVNDVRLRFEEGTRLAREGMLEASLLISWSGIEAGMRMIAEGNDIELPDDRSATLIGYLYINGELDREEYDLLMDYLHRQDDIIHGYRSDPIVSDDIVRMRNIIDTLLAETVLEGLSRA